MKPQKNQTSPANKSRSQKNKRGVDEKARVAARVRKTLLAWEGQPWEHAYPAICEVLASQQKDRLEAHVLAAYGIGAKTSLKDGKVRVHHARGVEALEQSSLEWYVDPHTQTLIRNPHLKARQEQEAARREREKAAIHARRRDVDASHQLHKLDTTWWLVELAPLPTTGAFDALLGRAVSPQMRYELQQQYGKADVFCVRKRPLVYKELQALSLS